MIEARITCMVQNLILADLGLNLSKGDVVYVEESAARNSKDLQRIVRVQGVVVQYLRRVQEVRAAVGVPKRGPIVIVQPPARPDVVVPAPVPLPAPVRVPVPSVVVVPQVVPEVVPLVLPEPIDDMEGVDSLWESPAFTPTVSEPRTTRKKNKKNSDPLDMPETSEND